MTLNNLHLTVAAIVEEHGRFLMVEERAHGELVINQPAGHVEPGETLIEAVAREALEETAWHFTPEALVGIYLWQHPGSGEHFLRAAFTGKHHDHTDAALDTGIERALWLSRDELVERAEQLRSPMVLRGIDDYFAGKRFDMNVFSNIDTDTLIDQAALIPSA